MYGSRDMKSFRNVPELLKAEGMLDSGITWDEDFKIEDENGFVSWRIEHGYPCVSHFYIDKDKRNLTNAIKLYRKFKKVIIEKGYDHFIAVTDPDLSGKTFSTFIKTCLKCKEPYATEENMEFYLIGVKT